MIPQTGICAYFTMVPRFAALNGIYKVIEIQAFSAAMSANVDFTNLLYVPAGLTGTNWSNDYTTYQGQDVYYLQSVNVPIGGTATVYPVPASLLLGPPDLSVKKYPNLYATLWFGAWKDPGEITWVINQISQLMTAVTGETDNLNFFSKKDGEVWLTDAQYAETVTQRAQAAAFSAPPAIQIQNLTAQVNQLNALVQHYEALLAGKTTSN